MGFDIKMANIDAMYDQYLAYADPDSGSLAHALTALRTAVQTFSNMQSFKGEAAAALKGYLMDMHIVFTASLRSLCALLKTEYATLYLARYAEAPLSENGAASLPEDELDQKKGLLAQMRDERIPTLQAHLDRAQRLLPPSFGLSAPSTAPLEEAVALASDDIQRLEEGVRAIEEEARSRFEERDGLFASLLQQVNSNIQSTALSAEAITSYVPGSLFLSDACRLEARARQATDAFCAERADVLIPVQDQMLMRQIVREEEAYRLMEEGRSQWELVGIGASVVGTLAAAAAVVGTGGAAAAVIAGAGALRSASGTFMRIQDRISQKHASDEPAGDASPDDAKSKAFGSSVIAASASISQILKGRQSSISILNGSAKGAVSITGNAAQALTVLADHNHDRMRQEAQARLRRIDALKAQLSSSKAA